MDHPLFSMARRVLKLLRTARAPPQVDDKVARVVAGEGLVQQVGRVLEILVPGEDGEAPAVPRSLPMQQPCGSIVCVSDGG